MGKNILVFMDGTRNKPSDQRIRKDTNVWKLYRAAAKRHDGDEETVLYVRGVGTMRDESVEAPADDLRLSRIGEWNPPSGPAKRLARLVQAIPKRLALKFGASAVGWGVADRIREGYGFICRHYVPGDQVYLFGFSRGAFEARSLAGFIDAVGLLLQDKAYGPDARRLVDKAYEIYRQRDPKAREFLAKFLRRMTRRSAPAPATDFHKATNVRLHFLGVWDTVEALGIGELEVAGVKLGNAQVPFVRRHTMHHAAAALPANVQRGRHALAGHELRRKFEPLLWDAPLEGQDLKQVWFAGAHADVGGGYQETHLSDLALWWMADEVNDVGAETPEQIRFSKLPGKPDPEPTLLPHHALQGDFFWADPAPRHAMVNFGSLDPAVRATLSLHPSMVSRLFDSTATTYESYSFVKDYEWTARLPGGKTYPGDVAGALSWLDDLSVQMHVAGLEAGPAGVGASSPSGRRPAWHSVSSVAELRLAEEYVLRQARSISRWPREVARLEDALAVLIVCGRETALSRFIEAVEASSARLVRVAARSRRCGAQVRRRRLPIFDDLYRAADGLREQGLPQYLRKVDDLVSRIGEAKRRLQSSLPVPIMKTLKLPERPPSAPESPT